MFSENLMKDINAIYRNDELIKQLLDSVGIELDEFNFSVDDLVAQYWTDTVTWGIPIWENLLGIKTDENKNINDRRATIEARWKSDGKSDLNLIQAICNTWKNGEVSVAFVNGQIKLTFNSIIGVPVDLQGLLNAVDDVKPAHLAVIYVLKYLLVKHIHNTMTISQLNTQLINRFAF